MGTYVGGAVASWLVRSTPEPAVRARALAGDIVFTLTVPLSTYMYKLVLTNCWGNLINCGEVTCDGLASSPGEVEILLAASCYRDRDKLRQLWASLGSKASLNSLYRKKPTRLQKIHHFVYVVYVHALFSLCALMTWKAWVIVLRNAILRNHLYQDHRTIDFKSPNGITANA